MTLEKGACIPSDSWVAGGSGYRKDQLTVVIPPIHKNWLGQFEGKPGRVTVKNKGFGSLITIRVRELKKDALGTMKVQTENWIRLADGRLYDIVNDTADQDKDVTCYYVKPSTITQEDLDNAKDTGQSAGEYFSREASRTMRLVWEWITGVGKWVIIIIVIITIVGVVVYVVKGKSLNMPKLGR